MNSINEFDHKYCLNLDRREDRWLESSSEFKKHNIKDVERFSASDGNLLKPIKGLSRGEVGIIHSYIRILNDAIINKYNSIIIFEDDAIFDSNFTEKFKIYSSQLPHNWEFINFGGLNPNNNLKFLSDNIYELNQTLTTHCIAIKSNIFKDLISLFQTYNNTLDYLILTKFKEWNSFGFFPAIVRQRKSYSDIREFIIDYGWEIKYYESKIIR